MAGKKDDRDSICSINGEVMTIEERNRRMKLEYVNGGKSLKDIAKDYGLTYNTVRVMSCNEKWKDYKLQFVQKVSDEVEQKLKDVYVNTQVDINLMYNNAWQEVMYLVVHMLNTKDGLLNKQGQLDVYRLNQLADVLTKAQNGQGLCTGFLDKKTQVTLDMQKQALDTKMLLAGMGETDVIEDNFLDALNETARRVFGDTDGSESKSKE